MSLKGVELQIALPKTFEAGKALEQHQQNVIQQQHQANEALKKDIQKKQLALVESEGTEEIKNDKEQQDSQYENKKRKKKKKEEQQENKKAKHPFKGNIIDYRG